MVGGDDTMIFIQPKDKEKFEEIMRTWKGSKTPLCLGLETVDGLTKEHQSYYSKIIKMDRSGIETSVRSLGKLLYQIHLSDKINKDLS
jgi:hypothetical protein